MQPKSNTISMEVVPCVTAEPRNTTGFIVKSFSIKFVDANSAEVLGFKLLVIESDRGYICDLIDFVVYPLAVSPHLDI